MDAFLLQIAIVFVPGFIWASIDIRFGRRQKPGRIDFFVIALIYGLVSYLAVYVLYSISGHQFSAIDTGRAADGYLITNQFIDEILISIPVSLILSVFWLYQSNYKISVRLLQRIGATKNYGDEDVWDFTFNSGRVEVEYVHFRDLQYRLVYAGWVNAFSESGKLREILLQDVVVHNLDTGDQLYEIPSLYVARESTHITIDFPHNEATAGRRSS